VFEIEWLLIFHAAKELPAIFKRLSQNFADKNEGVGKRLQASDPWISPWKS